MRDCEVAEIRASLDRLDASVLAADARFKTLEQAWDDARKKIAEANAVLANETKGG